MKTSKVPKNIDDHPLVAAFASRRAELAFERNALNEDNAEIYERLRQKLEPQTVTQPQSSGFTDTSSYQTHALQRAAAEKADRRIDPLIHRANELAFGPQTPTLTDQERLAENEVRLRELNAALTLLHSRIQQARGQASAEICAGLTDDHKAIEKTFARKMADATSAALEYHQFITGLEDAGIQTSSLETNLPFFLHATDKYDTLAQWFRASVERGVLTLADVPPRFDWTK